MNKKYKQFIIIEVTIIIGIVAIWLFINSDFITLIPRCKVREYLGILCPGCGGTTCVANILRGNFLTAMKANIIIFIAIIYFMILNIVYIINTFKKKQILKFVYLKEKYVYAWLAMYLVFEVVRNI